MAHSATAASIRGFHCNYQSKPREGSAVRKLYDRFMANKGIVIELVTHGTSRERRITYHQIEQLRNTYGLDIRMIRYRQWVLAGEWFGGKYVDYIAERLREEGRT